MTSSPRRVVAIVFGNRSAPAMSLAEAASSLCDIVWVVNSREMSDPTMVRLLKKLGRVVDISDMTPSAAAEVVGSTQPDGIVAFGDAQIATASALGAALGLEYHDAVVAERLLDKLVQRQALRDAGVASPRCVALSSRQSPTEQDVVIRGTTFPAILKPRYGAASRETHRVDDVEQLRALARQVLEEQGEPDLVIEDFLSDPTSPPSDYFGNYVSVESVVSAGTISHLGVTGRLPSAKPFRETGLIIPSDFAPSLVADILSLATRAVNAIGIQHGCLHTEIKVTDDGPRVIEVNGRIGGFVAPVLALASPGLNFYEMALRIALGERIVVESLVSRDHVGYVIVGQPPIGARRVAQVTGLDELAHLPGVDSVSLNRRPGDEVDWRLGSHEYVFSVLGTAPHHAGVRAVQQFIDEHVIIDFD